MEEKTTDSQRRTHALRNDLAIVIEDADFSQRIVLVASPPRGVSSTDPVMFFTGAYLHS